MGAPNLSQTSLVVLCLSTSRAQVAALETDLLLKRLMAEKSSAGEEDLYADALVRQIADAKENLAGLGKLSKTIAGELEGRNREVYEKLVKAALLLGEVSGTSLSLTGGALILGVGDLNDSCSVDEGVLREAERLRPALSLLDEGRHGEAVRTADDILSKARIFKERLDAFLATSIPQIRREK